MALTDQQVRRIAELARLGLSDDEIKKFAGQLTDIFQFVEMLNEVDTDNVEPTSQVTGLENVLDDDEVINFVEDKNELLECSPLEKSARQIKVKNVF